MALLPFVMLTAVLALLMAGWAGVCLYYARPSARQLGALRDMLLLLLLPCAALFFVIPRHVPAPVAPLVLALLLLPVLLWFPLKTARSIAPLSAHAAAGLGLDRRARLRLLWWPLWRPALVRSFFLCLVFVFLLCVLYSQPLSEHIRQVSGT